MRMPYLIMFYLGLFVTNLDFLLDNSRRLIQS
jgi:hypothetical protein